MIKVCRTCKKRTFNPEQGIVCSLTNAKPTFGDECPELELDEERLKREEMAAKANEETISDGRLEGSRWFMWIALLSLANIVLFFIGWRFIFGFGTTEIIQALIMEGAMDIVTGIVLMSILPAFFVWIWWGAAKRGYKWAYKTGWIVYLVDMIIYTVVLLLGLVYTAIQEGVGALIFASLSAILCIGLRVVVQFWGLKRSAFKTPKQEK